MVDVTIRDIRYRGCYFNRVVRYIIREEITDMILVGGNGL